MKTHWKTLSVLAGGLVFNGLAQDAPSATTSTTSAAPAAQYGISSGGRGSSFSGGGSFGGSPSTNPNFNSRLAGVVSRSGGSGQNAAIYFEGGSEKQMDEMAEDLQVLEYIISRNIDRALGEHATQYRLGVPMLLRGDGRAVQASYLQGFGVLVKINTPFAVAGAGEENQKRKEVATASEWEKARWAVKGAEGESGSIEADAGAFDGRLVATLKKEIFDSLKNASNLRHVKDNEWIAVAISGGGSGAARPTAGGYSYGNGAMLAGSGSPISESVSLRPKASMLTIRVKKSSASGSAADIEKSAQVLSYFDGAAEAAQRRRTSSTAR